MATPAYPLNVQQILSQRSPYLEEMMRPYQPQPIDAIQNRYTGYEPKAVGIGKVALDFLQGVRQRRIADFLEAERNNEMALNQYRAYVAQRLASPDLTDEGRRALEKAANDR